MTSLVHQLWLPVASDSYILARIPDGIKGILGDDDSPKPPAPNAPWLYLELTDELPGIEGEDYEGQAVWHANDWPHAGHGRMRHLLAYMVRTFYFAVDDDEARFADDVTGEVIWTIGPGYLAGYSEAQDMAQNTMRAIWPYRKFIQGVQ